MKSKNPLALVAAWLGLTIATGELSHAQSAGAGGSIRGHVSNSATGENLEGVKVLVRETQRSVATERDGSFEITSLSPGGYHLLFEYPGLDSKEALASVAGPTATRVNVSLTSGIYAMSKFTVTGEREGNAAAIVQQREAINLQNIVTSDAFGSVARNNLGNFLKRIPGATGIFDKVDVESIALRGMAPYMTSIDIDGTRVSNPDADTRAQSVTAINTEIIERAEVIKALTPDLDADSIAGRINLRTKSAFDRKARAFTLRAAGSYSPTHPKMIRELGFEPVTHSVSATYSDIYSVFGGERNLGMFINANADRIMDVRNSTNFALHTPAGSTAVPPGQKGYYQWLNSTFDVQETHRRGASMRFDFKPERHSEYQLSFGVNELKHGRYRPRPLIASGTINTTLSDPDPLFTVINGARAGIQDEYRKRDSDRVFANFRGEHRLGTFKLDYDATYDRSERLEQMALTNWSSNKRFNYALDRRPGSGSMEFPVIRVIAGPAFPAPAATTAVPGAFPGTNPFGDDFSNVGAATLNVFDLNTENQIIGGRVNVTKPLELRWPVELKTGYRYRNARIRSDREQFVGNLNLAAVSNNLTRFLRDGWDLGPGHGRYPVANVASIDKVLAASRLTYVGGADPRTRFTFDPAVASMTTDTTVRNSLFLDRELEETLHAGYVQGQVTAGKLKLLTGVRAERTQMERDGAVRNQNLTDIVAQYSGRQRTEKSYTNYFPSAHLRYTFGRNLILHTSYSTTIGRPNYPDLVAGAEVNYTSKVITVPNLDLRPQMSQNYDASLEYYFEPVGVVSLGVFHKDITDFPFTLTRFISEIEAVQLGAGIANPSTTVDDWRVTNKINGGSGEANGFELSYSQHFTFLPGWWRGFGVFANYTYVDAEGSYTLNGVRTNVQLEEYVPKTMNAGLSYALGRWDLRAQYSWSNAYVESYNSANPDILNLIRGGRWQIDFFAKVQLMRNIQFFLDVINVTKNNGRVFHGREAGELGRETFIVGVLGTAGVQLKF